MTYNVFSGTLNPTQSVNRVVWYLPTEAHGHVNIQRRATVVDAHSYHLS